MYLYFPEKDSLLSSLANYGSQDLCPTCLTLSSTKSRRRRRRFSGGSSSTSSWALVTSIMQWVASHLNWDCSCWKSSLWLYRCDTEHFRLFGCCNFLLSSCTTLVKMTFLQLSDCWSAFFNLCFSGRAVSRGLSNLLVLMFKEENTNAFRHLFLKDYRDNSP